MKKTSRLFSILTLFFSLAASGATADSTPDLTPDSLAANELANAKRLLQAVEARIAVARASGLPLDAADLRKVDALKANIVARGGMLAEPAAAVPVQTTTEPTTEPKVEPTSRLTAWSGVLQKQMPIRKGTRLVVEGQLATVIEVLHPYQVAYLRMDGAEGLLTGRREYPAVYATVEVTGIEAASIFKGDLIQSRSGALVGSVEAVFDDGSVFVQRLNGQIERLGIVGESKLKDFTFSRTRASNCKLSF